MSFTVQFKVKAIIELNVVADTLEEALRLGKEKANNMGPFKQGLTYVDGHVEVVGVTGDWGID